jgi:hypothetical protein
MWLFSTIGFFSVVIDNQHEGRLLIRARCRQDAFNLFNDYHKELPSMTKPTSDESRDYRWRLSIDRTDWPRLAARLAESVTYSNFKSAVAKQPGQANKIGALHEVWATMARLQWDERPEPVKRKVRKG